MSSSFLLAYLESTISSSLRGITKFKGVVVKKNQEFMQMRLGYAQLLIGCGGRP